MSNATNTLSVLENSQNRLKRNKISKIKTKNSYDLYIFFHVTREGELKFVLENEHKIFF